MLERLSSFSVSVQDSLGNLHFLQFIYTLSTSFWGCVQGYLAQVMAKRFLGMVSWGALKIRSPTRILTHWWSPPYILFPIPPSPPIPFVSPSSTGLGREGETCHYISEALQRLRLINVLRFDDLCTSFQFSSGLGREEEGCHCTSEAC